VNRKVQPIAIGKKGAQLVLEKGLPANLDAERFILGSVLLDDSRFVEVAGTVTNDDFALEKHRRIFGRMKELHQRGEKIDRVTVANELLRYNELESVDGLTYLVSLDDGLPHIAHLDSYVRIVREKAALRRLAIAGQQLMNRALMAEDDPGQIITGATEMLASMQRCGPDEPTATSPQLISASQLYQGGFPELRPIFRDLLWNGLTMLIARPKAGKSWLTLQLAAHKAGGRQVDGLTAVDCGQVLYGAFEEPKARTMKRLLQIAEPGEWADRLQFVYDLLPLMGGGAEQLRLLVEQTKPRLVVLDTLTALIKGGGKRESDVFRSQYAEVSCIRKIAEDFQTAIVVVHHTRKGMSDGAIEAIAGTGGIGAAIDAVWHLKRKSDGEATLDTIGRESEEKTFALRFDQDPFGWRVLGDDAEQLLTGERRELLILLRDEGALTPADIAINLGKSRPAIRMLLKRMKEDRQVEKQGSKYVPISHSVSYSVTERENEKKGL
jgi:hypothetical protein